MRKGLLLSFLSLYLCGWTLAQEIKGVIKDEANLPLPAVTITVEGKNRLTKSNTDGSFSIAAAEGDKLNFSLIGFERKTVSITNQGALTIILKESLSQLEDVVVIGYQTVSRKKNTAAISSISGKELENLPAASFDILLQGRLAGVNVQNFTGQPGVASSVSVRGTTGISTSYDQTAILNNPLYVVDGIPQPAEQYASMNTGTGTNYLAGLNPNDIESVDVLRDASAAAIYGSRAANGVILITTKKGRSAEPQVVFNAYAGVTMRPDLRDITLGSIERRQKMKVIENQVAYADQRNLPFLLTDSLNPAFNGRTNWQDLFFRRGLVRNGDISLSGGGNGQMSYRFSGGYYQEDGIIRATGLTRYSTRLNLLSNAMKEKLTINPIIAYTRLSRARGSGDDVSPLKIGAGNMPTSLLNLSDSKRAFLLGSYDDNLDQNIDNQLSVNLNLTYRFSPKLQLTSQTSYLNNNRRRDQTATNELNSGQGNSSLTFSSNQDNFLTSNYFSYNNTFSRHTLSAILGQDIQYDKYQTTSASGWYGVSDQIQVINGFLQNNITAGSNYQSWGLLSYYARLSYDFDGKYLFSGSLRTDGSSRFGKNNKWGYFPAASVGWLLSEENFLKDNPTISMLKLRGSYGTSGSLPRQNYLQYNLYNVNAAGFAGNSGAASYNGVASIIPNFVDGVAQKNLSWEKSKQWNIGTDLELLQGKYSVTFDVYNKESSLQLFAVELPVTTGYDRAFTNSVGVRNAGFDLILNANPLPQTSKIKWMSNFNISYNKNSILNLPNGGRDLVLAGDRFNKSHILSVGSPINMFYLYQTLGVYSTIDDIPVNPYTGERFRNSNGFYNPGDFQFADLDGDYFIDVFNSGINPDKLPIGDPNPKWTGGWNNTFSYKNFSLTVFCTFTFDRDVLNLFESDAFSNATSGGAIQAFANVSIPDLDAIDIWRNPGDRATYAKMDIGSYRYYYTSDQTFFLEKGDYFRVKNIIGSYDFGKKFLNKTGLGRFRVYGIMDNVLMLQRSKKLPDAEAVNQYGEYNGGGYPIPRKFTLGLEVTF
ncbi:SusC/RagA family TonB-linked outer membrane protein [Olivibacter jilunii]|uniref:SusC/RagA family TonB-linked outer membrane protein n=1 Tax=Olivibacter jilunii TaxID=985016 RepID=UPI003F171E52